MWVTISVTELTRIAVNCNWAVSRPGHSLAPCRKGDDEDYAEDARAEERRDHLDCFFDATIDTFLAALNEGQSEAEARELRHIQWDFDFYNHGWTEMMEFPSDELESHYDRYGELFQRHGISIHTPLGEFRPDGGVPDAPTTPEKLDDPEQPHPVASFADDVYVETEDGDLVVGGGTEPDEVAPSVAPGVDPKSSTRPPSECSRSGIDHGSW